MSSIKDPELDPIARQIAREDFHDLTIPTRLEVLKIVELRKQTAAIEAQADAMRAILAHVRGEPATQ